jgi:apolipoprotein N-acyltransferase
LPFRDWRLTTLICYEDIIPGFVRRAVSEGDPHLLVNITNDSWFGDSNEPWIHLALAQFRAVEHHRYLVRATNSGVSAVVDPLGRVVTRSGVFERASLHAEVAMLQGATVYQMAGDWPGWLGLAWTLFALFRRRS